MAANYERATAKAKMLLNSNSEYSTRPVNLALILEDLGLDAQYSDEIEDEALLDPMERMIYIRIDDFPMTRKLFSIAHEIGHWMLHSKDKRRPRNTSNNNIDEEQEANAFAAELLMPYDEVRNLIMLGYNIENLANHFNVSLVFASNRYNFIISRVF
ncbi:ImmA/IrrE family metallo-endopeptidase [Aliarcobacter butzleri]|uniref:ImmA/IrrE family metallo-endopeptidase n=1 Tax=Aliarcobacter butzleri TaxID=28197 RepID=UPI001EDB7981|nr:ImmA/IrrE family metallo-endopeptidase [Aliarcobacter butzleri]MCG3657930.1 ImmA/IrrE family metallo-endopeptidase [Aliarcobacter butzleri]